MKINYLQKCYNLAPNQIANSFAQLSSEKKIALGCASVALLALAPLTTLSLGTAGAGCILLNRVFQSCQKNRNSNEIDHIYTPTNQKCDLTPYAAKIAILKKDQNVMGITFTFNKQNELIPIYIVRTQNTYLANFFAYDLSTNEQLGFAFTKFHCLENNYLTNYWLGRKPEEYIGYGPNRTETNKTFLDQVTNESQCKNIGVILIKAIQQVFMEKKFEGRILIEAVRQTPPYHYKMGFRAFNPKTREFDSKFNSLCASYLQRKEIPKKDLGLHYMYLPEAARNLWSEEIKNNPIISLKDIP